MNSKKARKIFTAILIFLLILTFIMVYVPLLFIGDSNGGGQQYNKSQNTAQIETAPTSTTTSTRQY